MKKTALVMLGVLLFIVLAAYAQTPDISKAPQAYECTQLNIDEVDETLLTKAERLAMMERQLQQSMDRYESCVTKVQKNMANQGGGGGGNGGGKGDGANDESSSQSSFGEQMESENSQEDGQTTVSSENLPPTQQKTPTERGIVKPKDNDSIICKLLWDEIQKATPEKRAGFEKQYKDYKCG